MGKKRLTENESVVMIIAVFVAFLFLVLVVALAFVESLNNRVLAQNPVKREVKLMQDTVDMDSIPLPVQMKIMKKQAIMQKEKMDSMVSKKKKQ